MLGTTQAPLPSIGSVGAVIVTYKTPTEQLQKCLKSLRQNDIHSVSIVNNDTTNPGFATAANQGAAKITNELILFINPDAELIPNTITKAVRLFQNQQEVGVVGLMLCNLDHQEETHCFGPPVTPISLFLRHFMSQSIPSQPRPVGWVSGGAMIIRRSAFQALAGFDPQYFLYWEDVDLCHRARQAGWHVYIVPSIKVVHQRGASLRDLAKKTRYYDQSADKYFHKHYSKPIWLFQHYSRILYRFLSHSVD
jgi:GT2 family glycosyltransferase